MNYIIETMKPSDWNSVSEIYKEGIDTKVATFQSEVPTWEDWDKSHCEHCRLIVRLKDQVLGWAALSPVSKRSVYVGVAEVSIYIRNNYTGMNIGTALLEELIKNSENQGYWTLQSGIIEENVSSLKLHNKCGFRKIGYRENVGKMDNGKWHNVILVERRSKIIGI